MVGIGPLFNKNGNSLYGSVILTRAWSTWLIVATGGLIGLLVCSFLYFASYTKRTTIAGVLVPASGLVRILPLTAGIVEEKRVTEGPHVQKGQVLFILSDERRTMVDDREQRLSDAHSRSFENRRSSFEEAMATVRVLNQQTEVGLRGRLASTREEIRHTQRQIELQTRRVADTNKMLERYIELEKKEFISRTELQDKRDQLETIRSQLISAERQRSELVTSLILIQSELTQTKTRSDGQLADLTRQSAELAQEAADVNARDIQIITAPISGVVTAITAQVGQSIGARDIAVVLPDGAKLVALLFAPSKSVGFIKTGQSVRLRYQAFPYQRFGQYAGTIIEVSRNPLSPSDIASVAPPVHLASDEGIYRVTVKIVDQELKVDGEMIPLLSGMIVEGDIEQQRRRLIEWIIEPLTGLKKVVA